MKQVVWPLHGKKKKYLQQGGYRKLLTKQKIERILAHYVCPTFIIYLFFYLFFTYNPDKNSAEKCREKKVRFSKVSLSCFFTYWRTKFSSAADFQLPWKIFCNSWILVKVNQAAVQFSAHLHMILHLDLTPDLHMILHLASWIVTLYRENFFKFPFYYSPLLNFLFIIPPSHCINF